MIARACIANPDKFYIGGTWTTPSSATTIDVLNSATEDLFARVAAAQEADVNQAVAAARSAFDGPWPRMAPAQRAGFLGAIARELGDRLGDTAMALTCESGMIHGMAQMLAHMAGAAYAETAGYAESFPFEEKRETSFGMPAGLLVHEPVGVVAAIVPWNGPAAGIAHKVAPALLAGCTVVLKVAPEAPVAGYILAEVCEKVGLPAGVLNVIAAEREASELLVRHRDIDMVAFTGSTATGKRIAAICAERVARYQLELGGKSPAVIFDDFDVATAAKTLAASARLLTGQVCASLTRFIVTDARHDAFVDALAAAYGATKVGDPFDPDIQMGPLATRRQRERVEGYIAKGKHEGARLIVGGGRPAHLDRGWFVEPTVFADVDNNSTIGREEIFGPVLCVIRARDEEDALRIANDTNYGLNASVFTNDVERAYAAARRIRSGTVGHNGMCSDLAIGFGGFKQSGVGREGGGPASLNAYVESKTVLLNGFPRHLG